MLAHDGGLRISDAGLAFGLTGGVACGKSTVARFFSDLGACVIDADVIGHELTEPGTGAFQEIQRHFGKEILDAAGRIDRKSLGLRVFADAEQRRRLNAIVHPRVIARVGELTAEQIGQNPRAVVIVDAPLIFEAGISGSFRKIIAVWCRPDQQLERLMAKTGLPREEAERRIRAQIPAGEKARRADYVIDCSGTMEHSRDQVQAIYPELRRILDSRS